MPCLWQISASFPRYFGYDGYGHLLRTPLLGRFPESLMLKTAKYTLLAFLLNGATFAAAADLPPEITNHVMNACRPDYHRVCDDVLPGDGRVGRCLQDHEEELSPGCLKAVKFAHAIEACMPDYHRYCEGLQPGDGQILRCLSERTYSLAPECARVVTANAPYADPNGRQYGYNSRPSYGAPYPHERYSEGDPYRAEPYRHDESRGPNDYRYPPRDADAGHDRYRDHAYNDDRYAEREPNREHYYEGGNPPEHQYYYNERRPEGEPYRDEPREPLK